MNRKYSFKDDYSEGAHPRILEAVHRYNSGQEEGYGLDGYCLAAADEIRQVIGKPDAAVHFVSGGTQANLLVLSSALKPYESVLAAQSAHIVIHETGAIESAGHKIHSLPSSDGKLNPGMLEEVLGMHVDEHMVLPRAVYISQSTEYGSLYSKNEMLELSGYCRENGLFLYVDGARLAMALTARTNDLTLAELAGLVDAFYIGGTKNGGLIGEAIVFTRPDHEPNFRFVMKQKGALIAKGRIFGVQFQEMFRDDLFFQLGKIANDRAEQLADGIRRAGYEFWIPTATNQIFPILPNSVIRELRQKYDFYEWTALDKDRSVIRLVTSWATPEEAVQEFVKDMVHSKKRASDN